MAGQQSQFENSQEALFNKHNKVLLNQIDLWYINEKFAIKTEYNENKTMYNYLMKNLYQTDNCEVIKFIGKKLRGVLEEEDITIVNLGVMQTQHSDINNYYYYTNATYEDVQW